PHIHGISEISEKLVKAESRLRHLGSLTWDSPSMPPHLRVSVTELQGAKEFVSSPEFFSLKEGIEQDRKVYQEKVLANAVKAKRDEVAHLMNELLPKCLFDRLKAVVLARWTALQPDRKVPVFSYKIDPNDTDDNGDAMQVEDADRAIEMPDGVIKDIEIKRWITSPAAVHEFESLLRLLPSLATRIISISREKDETMRAKLEKKQKVVKDANAMMADVATPGPSLQSLVDKAVNARVKSELDKVAKNGSGKNSGIKVSRQDLRHPPKNGTPTPSRKLPSVKNAVKKAVKSAATKPKGKKAPGKPNGKGKGKAGRK
ncbi:hypothetical protein TRAPUB_5353, partial [Trametes pubescens]